MRCYFTSCTTCTSHTLDRTPLMTLCSIILSVSSEMLFYQLHHSYTVRFEPLDRTLLTTTSLTNCVSNEMLFHQLYLYDSCKSNHLTGQPLYSCLMRCNHVIYFTLLHSNISHSPLEPTAQIRTTRVLILRLEQVVSIGHVCYSHSSTLAFNPIN